MTGHRPTPALTEFTASVIALRRDLAPVFDGNVLTGRPLDGDPWPDVAWLTADGQPIADWDNSRTLVAVLFAADTRAALIFHADATQIALTLPTPRLDHEWCRVLDTAPGIEGMTIAPRSVTVFQERPAPAPRSAPDHASTSATPSDADLDHLAEQAGINPIWWDVDGGYHKVGADAKRALLAAMRLPATTVGDLNDSLVRLLSEPVLPPAVTAQVQATIPIRLGRPRPAWVTLLRDDGSLERFARTGRLCDPASATHRPPSPADRGPARTRLPPHRRTSHLLPAATAVGRRPPVRHCRAPVFVAIPR